MLKTDAIRLLGGEGKGARKRAAEKVGVTPQAISAWPRRLPGRIADRVVAALARSAAPALQPNESETLDATV